MSDIQGENKTVLEYAEGVGTVPESTEAKHARVCTQMHIHIHAHMLFPGTGKKLLSLATVAQETVTQVTASAVTSQSGDIHPLPLSSGIGKPT